jgi:cell wall-associated NlpC family hydrolase
MSQITPLTLAERGRFIASARNMVGTPFGHRGRSARKVDCVGLVALALASVGRYVADRRSYGRNPENDGLREVCEAHFGPPVADMRAGDVALFAWDAGCNRTPNHVGILFDHPNGGLAVVHALKQNERVIEHGLDDATRALIVAVYRPWSAAE